MGIKKFLKDGRNHLYPFTFLFTMSAVNSMLSGVNERLQQLLVMVKKDTRLAVSKIILLFKAFFLNNTHSFIQIRSWKVSSIQILAPFVCLLLLLILQVIPHPAIYESMSFYFQNVIIPLFF